MQAFTLSDPDALHALIGCYLYLNADTGDVEGAVAITTPSRGLLVLTTRPAVVLCPYLETLEEGAAALVLGLSGEAAYSLQAAELALRVIDTTEEMGVPVSIGQAAEPWGESLFRGLGKLTENATAHEQAAAQFVAFRFKKEILDAAGENSHSKAREHFQAIAESTP